MVETARIREGLFRETAGAPVLLGSRCWTCERTHFPPTPMCLDCLGTNMNEIELPREGTLFSYTIVRMPSANFPSGHVVGYVSLHDDLRIFAPLNFEAGSSPEIDQTLRLEIAPLWQDENDASIVGYRFSPVGSSGEKRDA